MSGGWYERNAARYARSRPGLPGDVEYYRALARRCGPPVLELCSGDGRMALAIAAAGIAVVGVEQSAAMVQAARARVQGGDIRFVQGDARVLALPERFALVCIPYRSFSHMLTPADQRAMLTTARTHLHPGGLLALNIVNPAPLARLLSSPPGWRRPLFGSPYPGVRVRHAFADEMAALLAGAGFVEAQVAGWFDGRPFTDDSSEQVWTARRPESSVQL